MSDDKPKSKPNQVMDVSHPGKSAPTGNSKSVIVTHRAVIQDPMVNTTPESASDPMPAKRTAPVLKPGGKAPETPPPLKAPIPEPTTDTEPAAEEPAAPAPAQHKELNLAPLTPTKEPVASDDPEITPAVDVPPAAEQDVQVRDMDKADDIGQTSSDGKTAKAVPTTEEIDAEQAKKDTALQKLVDSKKYFLPINTLENRRTQRFIALGILFALLLGAAWLDVALDAGILHIEGLKPLTHFFSN